MPFRLPVVSLIVAAGIVNLPITADAQDAPPLWIQSVTVDVAAGTATVTGTGFSETCAVTLDGHALTVLPGGTAAHLVVVVPALLLATPGTYRLTVTDAVRTVVDAFEITITDRREVPVTASGSSDGTRHAAGPLDPDLRPTHMAAPGDAIGPRLVEDTASPWRTAIGYQALFSNTNGSANTASGFKALFSNTSGSSNTASGSNALFSNTLGLENTASGHNALYFNSTGTGNTANGMSALALNITGRENTAVGDYAGFHNEVGHFNVALGAHALLFNEGGYANTAIGTGSLTVALTDYNTGVGHEALRSTSTGTHNTALGIAAGSYNISGSHNIFIGADVYGADESHTMRLGRAYAAGSGINRTFIEGIRGTSVSGATPVGVTADGQLGRADKLGAGLGYGCDTCYQSGTIELYNPGTGEMTLQSAPSYRLLLNPAGGSVGVGVYGLLGAGAGFGCPSCYQNGYVELYNPNTGNLTVQSGTSFDLLLNPFGGNVGIGVADAAYPLQMASGAHVTAGGVWTNASSRALKDHITPLTLERAQEALLALAPVEYVYKADPSERQVGFIAEDVPALVAQNDRASLSPMDLVAVLTKVVQAQQAQLATLQVTVAQQGETIAALKGGRPREK